MAEQQETRSLATPPRKALQHPPTQVYTRGSTGVVKTRRLPERQNSLRTRSQNRDDFRGVRGGSSIGSRRSTNTGSAYTVRSAKSEAYRVRRESSPDTNSVNSAPSFPLKLNRSIDKVNKIPRTPSPSRSIDSHKHHSRTARRIIEELNRAQGTASCIAAITNACECFDHNNESKHNVELYHGAGQVLAKLLNNSKTDDETRMICAALEMVFRGSPKSCKVAFEMVGVGLLQNLLKILDKCDNGALKHPEVTSLSITRLLTNLSRAPELKVLLCHHKGMMEYLARLSSRGMASDNRQGRVRLIASLASHEENKITVYQYPGLKEGIVRIAHFDASEVARQYAALTLMEFASAADNQIAMARDDKLLSVLVKMVLVEKSSATRESAITALQYLAFAKENRVRLVTYRQGIALEALKKSLSSDEEAKARRRAAGTLTNLACEETAQTMGSYKGLLEALAIVATKDPNEDVQTRASLALTKISSSITIDMECHEVMLDALVVASLSKVANSISSVLRVKARDPRNREAMASHPGVLDTLCDICISDAADPKDRDNATRTLMHLVNEDKNRKELCNITILDALVASANSKDPEMEESRDSSIRALERLATEHSNRPAMARHEGLLVAVAKAVEREAKLQDQGIECEHGYLAKPLLMTLLLSM